MMALCGTPYASEHLDEMERAIAKWAEATPRDAQGHWATEEVRGDSRTISRTAKATLRRIEAQNRRKEVEHAAVVDPRTGEVRLRATSAQSYKVTIPKEERPKLDGAVVTHNHPLERALSNADLTMAIQYNMLAIRAVTPSGTTYELRRLGEWPKMLLRTYDRESSHVVRALFHRVLLGEMTNNGADAAFSHEVLKRVADHYPTSVKYTRSHL